tara:strand:+ start:106 stop:705 length:600 start_codon:yes stop_codon:yes gene_type:complete
MSQKTAKERVKAIYDCLAQNKKIKTISELSKILKVSSVVPRMLREKNVLMYNVSGNVVWNANMPYTLEMEEEIYAKTIEYSRQSETRRKEETLAEKARKETLEFYENEMSLQNIFDVLEENTAQETVQDTAQDVEYKVSFVEHAIISLEVSVANLHKKIDALTTKLAELNVDGKIRPRVRLTPTPTTNTTKHNFFGEDL